MTHDTRKEDSRIIGGQFLVQGSEGLAFGLRTVECIDQNSGLSVKLTFVSRTVLEQLGIAIRIPKDFTLAGALVHKNIVSVWDLERTATNFSSSKNRPPDFV